MPIRITLAVYLLLSLTAFIAYGRDKHLAREHKWRIPEKTLLALSFLGGAAGALLAMQIFRHKTKHWYFYAVGIAGLIWQTTLLIFLYIRQAP